MYDETLLSALFCKYTIYEEICIHFDHAIPFHEEFALSFRHSTSHSGKLSNANTVMSGWRGVDGLQHHKRHFTPISEQIIHVTKPNGNAKLAKAYSQFPSSKIEPLCQI
jgi:hypothetical protein